MCILWRSSPLIACESPWEFRVHDCLGGKSPQRSLLIIRTCKSINHFRLYLGLLLPRDLPFYVQLTQDLYNQSWEESSTYQITVKAVHDITVIGPYEESVWPPNTTWINRRSVIRHILLHLSGVNRIGGLPIFVWPSELRRLYAHTGAITRCTSFSVRKFELMFVKKIRVSDGSWERLSILLLLRGGASQCSAWNETQFTNFIVGSDVISYTLLRRSPSGNDIRGNHFNSRRS